MKYFASAMLFSSFFSQIALAGPTTLQTKDVLRSFLIIPGERMEYKGRVNMADPLSRECRANFRLDKGYVEIRYLLEPEDQEQLTLEFKFGRDSVKKLERLQREDGNSLYVKASRSAALFGIGFSAQYEMWLEEFSGITQLRIKNRGRKGLVQETAELSCQFSR